MEIEALLLLAREHERRQEWEKAIGSYTAAAQLAPGDHRIHANLGNAAWYSGQPQLALQAYRRAARLAPGCPLSLRGLGNALRDLGRFEAAARAYDASLRLDPDPLTAWNQSQVLIGLERYPQAYTAAERRFEVSGHDTHRPGPHWSGDTAALATADGPMRIWSEQGLGDTLQYLRWIPCLWRRLPPGCAVPVLEVESALVRLVEQGLGWLNPPPRALEKSRSGTISASTPQLSLLSLPQRLGGAPHPGETRGEAYLRHPGWAPRRPFRPSRRLGLVWASGRKLDDPFQAREYRLRSLPADALQLLMEGLRQRGVELVNLQVGPDREPPGELRRLFSGELPAGADFADTATFIADLDRVITVDTAMAHLVGALGREDWVLLPFTADPRWQRAGAHTPWYPRLRLFRQPSPGDWLSVIRQVLSALDGRRRNRPQQPEAGHEIQILAARFGQAVAALDGAAALRGQGGEPRRLPQHLQQTAGEPIGSVEVDQATVDAILNHLRDGRVVGSDDQRATGHRLEEAPGQRIGIGEVGVRGTDLHQADQVVIRNLPQEMQAAAIDAVSQLGQKLAPMTLGMTGRGAIATPVSPHQHHLDLGVLPHQDRQGTHQRPEAAQRLQLPVHQSDHRITVTQGELG